MTVEIKSPKDRLVALVEKIVAEERCESFGFKWAARPQLYYFDELGWCQKTVGRYIKKPPFVARRAQVNGNIVCLLRLGEAPS